MLAVAPLSPRAPRCSSTGASTAGSRTRPDPWGFLASLPGEIDVEAVSRALIVVDETPPSYLSPWLRPPQVEPSVAETSGAP